VQSAFSQAGNPSLSAMIILVDLDGKNSRLPPNGYPNWGAQYSAIEDKSMATVTVYIRKSGSRNYEKANPKVTYL
jgi:hypothetical protein